MYSSLIFFFQAEDGIRDVAVTGVQTCALPIYRRAPRARGWPTRAPAASSRARRRACARAPARRCGTGRQASPARSRGVRSEGEASAHHAAVGHGGSAPAEGGGERRLEAELARRRGAEEPQRARPAARGVEAHLALHHLGLAPVAEAPRGAQVRAVDRGRRRAVGGASPPPPR